MWRTGNLVLYTYSVLIYYIYVLYLPLLPEGRTKKKDKNNHRPPTTTMAPEPVDITEDERAARLLDAQNKAASLFDEIARDLLRPGVSEAELSREIHELAARRHAVRTHWHKRVVRSGPHTLAPYAENPPDRTLEAGDILFVDLGPVFEAWEADFGRTFVLDDGGSVDADEAMAHRRRLRDALLPTWEAVRARYRARPDMTGGELFDAARDEARAAGYEFGGPIAGHLVGHFPHERIARDKMTFYITEGNDLPMSRLDERGKKYHWILEMHMVDRERQIGGFMEELLTIG